jgi:glycosyltransferase involved in cell wall biosynthesis
MSALELSVVIPCHNEQDNLSPLVASINAALEPLSLAYEIIITDDRSTDSSWETLKRLADADPRVRGQRFQDNRGQSAAIWAGIQASRGSLVVTMDADLQNDPKDLPRFLEALKRADCVCGNRVESRREGDNIVRVLSSRIANWVRNKLSQETIADAGCGYRAFRRDCVADLKFFRGMHRFLPTLIKLEGYRVVEIPIASHPRLHGNAHYGVWNRLFESSYDLLAVRWMKSRMIRYEVVERLNPPDPKSGPGAADSTSLP